jgi:hypothetical protein
LFAGASRTRHLLYRHEPGSIGSLEVMSTGVSESTYDVTVSGSAVDMVRAVLRAVAAGEPVDNPCAAAEAAYALAALPPAQPRVDDRT